MTFYLEKNSKQKPWSIENAKAEIEKANKLGVKILLYSDEEYPITLKGDKNSPPILYVKGDISTLNYKKSIAIVGGRAASITGRKTAAKIAMDLGIEKDIPFHRAFSDAYYTARVLACLEKDVLENYSIDTYILPANRQEEIHVMFHDYMKYISREFPDKQKALEDREVISTKCYLCHKNLRKKIRWFSPNGKHYYSVSFCPIHGHMKSKIRVRKSESDGVYIVKTSKFISEEESQKILQKRDQAKEHRKLKKNTAKLKDQNH